MGSWIRNPAKVGHDLVRWFFRPVEKWVAPMGGGCWMVRYSALALAALLLSASFVLPMGHAAPVVSAIEPAYDDTNGGRTVAIQGSGFLAGLRVTIGGLPAVLASPVGADRVDVVVPPNPKAAPVDVVVTNPDGVQTTFGKGFTYTASEAPFLQRVGPKNEGSTNGGQEFTLQGGRWPDPTTKAYRPTVTFGGVRAEILGASGQSTLTVRTPPHPVGIVDVRVTNPDGQSATTAGGFTFVAANPPTIRSSSPAAGPSIGQALLTITGTNISASAAVTIGGLPATVTQPAASGCTTSCSIQILTPPHAPGRVDLVVQNPDGQTAKRTGWHNYTASPGPVLTTIWPPYTVPTTGGTTLCLDGTGFAQGVRAMVGGALATEVRTNHGGQSVDEDCPAGTDLSLVTPGHTAGPASIVVTNPDAQASVPAAIEYVEAVIIQSTSPAVGSCNGGTVVTVVGQGFGTEPIVTFNGVPAASVQGSGTLLAAVAPPGDCIAPDGSVDIAVVTERFRQGTLVGSFAYTAETAPVLAGTEWVTPASASTNGGDTVTIHGTGFHVGPQKPTVWFGDVAALVGAVTPTTIQVNVPTVASSQSGVVDVRVENPGSQMSQAGKTFTYVTAAAPPAPTLTGPAATSNGGTTFTLANPPGKPFASGANATQRLAPRVCVDDVFPDSACADGLLAEILSTTSASLSVRAPPIPGGSGTKSIYVIHPDGQVSPPVATGLPYTAAAAPTASPATPSGGPTLGWTPVTITGTGFATDGATVEFGGIKARVASRSSTSLQLLAPAHWPGTVDVVVTNPDGQKALAGTFTYLTGAAPALNSVTTAVDPEARYALLKGTIPNLDMDSAPSAVHVNGILVDVFVVLDSTSLAVLLPNDIQGPASVALMNVDGQSATLERAFHGLPLPPFLQGVNGGPTTAYAPSHGGRIVSTWGGQNLQGSLAALVGGTPAPWSKLAGEDLQFEVPARAAGPASVTVVDVFGQSASRSTAVTLVDAPRPTVRDLQPAAGPSLGGTSVRLTGTGFSPRAIIEFGGIRAASDQIVVSPDGTIITARTPSHEMGFVTVSVVNPDGDVGSLDNGFAFIGDGGSLDRLTIGEVRPPSGPPAGGTEVLIRGTGFGASASVTFGGVNATRMVVHNSTAMTVTAPPHAAGSAAILVTLGGKTASGGFTFLEATTPAATAVDDSGPVSIPPSTPPLVLTPNQVANANKRVKLTVTRVGDENILSWNLPNLVPADVKGVQVWRANSPYSLLAEVPVTSAAFANRTYRDSGVDAKETSLYLVTMFYGGSLALGRLDASNAPDQEQLSGTSSLSRPASTAINWVSPWTVGGAIALALIAAAVALAMRRRVPNAELGPEAASAFGWQAPGAGQVLAPQIHQTTCPRCAASFAVAGSRPLATMCPNCGTKGTLI